MKELKEIISNSGVLFGSVFVIILTLVIMSNFNTVVQADAEWTTEAKNFISTMNDRLPSAWDWGFFFIYIAFIIGSVFTAYKINQHPIYVIFAIIYLAVIVFISMIISNIYSEMVATNTAISTITASMPIINFILNHLVEANLIYAVIVGVVLFTFKK